MDYFATLLAGLIFGGFLVHRYHESKNKKQGSGGSGGKGEPGNSVEN